jgi:CheY-like chemotaxis protein
MAFGATVFESDSPKMSLDEGNLPDLAIINHPKQLRLAQYPVIDLTGSTEKLQEAIILTSPGNPRVWEVEGVQQVDYLMKPLRSLSLVRTLYPAKTILIVDDNRTNLQVARLLLKRLGLQVETAMSGQEALDVTSRTPPAIVFLDLQMPEMDGFETARELLKMAPTAYVVAMTAAATTEDRSASAAAGMRDFVPKPIKESDLSRALWTYYHESQ